MSNQLRYNHIGFISANNKQHTTHNESTLAIIIGICSLIHWKRW